MRVPLQFGTGFRRFTKHFAKPKSGSGSSKAGSSGRGSMEEEDVEEAAATTEERGQQPYIKSGRASIV